MAEAKQQLLEYQKSRPGDKFCVDCKNPNPQWSSPFFGIFYCLECAGIHRSLGVHIDFVRSVMMDAWQPEQMERMKHGGNEAFTSFIESYTPADQGGYRSGMSIPEKYQCWAATQYREKLTARVQGKEWAPSPRPATLAPADSTPATSPSAGLRKSRAATRNTTRASSSSPAPSLSNSTASLPDASRKAENESFFAGLGQANASRPADLPPSQGGRYTGFGNTPTPPPVNQHPSFGLSSAAAPNLTDFQENPVAALGKGWSLFSAAVAGASKVLSENVIQPGIEKVSDPNFIMGVKGYAAEAGKRAGDLGKTANEWGRNQLGVDVAEHMGSLVTTVHSSIAGDAAARQGYTAVNSYGDDETSALYVDAADDDFFAQHDGSRPAASRPTPAPPVRVPAVSAKADEWDEWKEF